MEKKDCLQAMEFIFHEDYEGLAQWLDDIVNKKAKTEEWSCEIDNLLEDIKFS